MSFIKSFKSSSDEQSSHSERTGVPKPLKAREVFSEINDGACGGPELAQHLVLDFTPDSEIDNEISQKKICDFWKFINNTPEIKNLMVKPERYDIIKPPATAEVPEVVKYQPEDNVVSMAKTACSMLEVVKEKELKTRAFEGRMPQSHCSLGSREFKENEDIREKKRAHRVPIICRCTKICTPCPVKKPPGAPLSTAKQLCTKLQEWDDKHPNLNQNSDTTRNPSSGGTSNPKPPPTLSDFKDGSCGEPLFAQHVVIDFTPNEDDNDLVQEKVCSFWKFINNSPEIQSLKVEPEKNLFTGDSKTEIVTESINSETEITNVVKVADRQAVEMLKFADEKNMIDTIFEAKLPQTMCSLGSREYKQSEVSTQPKKKEKKKHVCKCTPCLNPRCRNNKKASTVSSEKLSPVKVLSKKMNEWDAKHPNCYAFHPLIQRFVRIWRYVQVVSDVITFVLSMICCQCSDAMPLSSSASEPSVQIFEANALNRRLAEVDPGRCSGKPMKAQHLVIDFTPGRVDTPETEARCQEFWKFAKDRTELKGMMVQPTPRPQPTERQLIDLSKDSVDPEIVIEQCNSNLPAIHKVRKMNNKVTISDAMQKDESSDLSTSAPQAPPPALQPSPTPPPLPPPPPIEIE